MRTRASHLKTATDTELEPSAWPLVLAALYQDPYRPQTVIANDDVQLVSVPLTLGLEALDLLRRARTPLGPIAIDSRRQVRRMGFLLSGDDLAVHSQRVRRWISQAGARLEVRCSEPGAAVTLPALRDDNDQPLSWLVSPWDASARRTPPLRLLSALRGAARGLRRTAS